MKQKTNKKVKKHPAMIAWGKWLNSEEGKSCTKGEAEGKYLENRLWFAFMAGRGQI